MVPTRFLNECLPNTHASTDIIISVYWAAAESYWHYIITRPLAKEVELHF